jgi:hypothetical protein
MLNISYNKDGIFDFLICPSPFLGGKKEGSTNILQYAMNNPTM